jgi:pyruvate/2-oxoacid:ferredoxin oxidoreductase beta subunit/Pyruvate/2-oxoacid:ferredoxin oxidoreductase gamma subunit
VNEDAFSSYLNEDMLPYPFCPGCGHGVIVDHLNAALVKLQLDPRKVVVVTDIGCAGLSDRFIDTNALHGLHGRSVTYATGIKLANPELKVIVLIGDGGVGIGGNHVINAARRNIGVTMLVFNNLNYGMTGGEHSVTTPPGANTVTTRYGNLEHPLDICATVAVNGAGYVARSTTFDKDLPDLIARAIECDGFSLIDIWELCTAHFVPNNRYSRKALEETMDVLGFSTGVLHQDERPEYAHAYRLAVADQKGTSSMTGRPISTKYGNNLTTRLNCVIAGAAGQRIGTAGVAFSRGAVLSGLWATQRSDYPVTVRSGYSVSEVVLSPEEINYPVVKKPDLVVALFAEGLEKVKYQIEKLTHQDTIYIESSLLPVETQAKKIALDFRGKGKKSIWSVMAIAEVLRHSGIYPLEAFKEALVLRKAFAEQSLAAVEASEGMAVPV